MDRLMQICDSLFFVDDTVSSLTESCGASGQIRVRVKGLQR